MMAGLSKEKVRFLAFEGGGGKGIVYLGALQALEELEIISHLEVEKDGQTTTRLDTNKIKGISGTSVGAVSALLIACGYTSNETNEILTSDIGNEMLDTVDFGLIPTIYSEENENCVVKDSRFKDAEKYISNAWTEYLQSDEKSFKKLMEVPLRSLRRVSLEIFAYLLRGYLNFELRKSGSKKHEERFHFIPIHEIIHSESQKTTANSLLKKPLHSINSMVYEYGFFLGAKAREFFDGYIEKKSGIKNCTFEQFSREFNIDLVITSVCLNLKEVLYFRNNEKWKNLCVADAVRMSIGIPFLFKPVLFEEKDGEFKSFSGDFSSARFMVDGGVEDNFPIRVFDDANSKKLNPQVIGFTLEPESKKRVTEIPNFIEYTDNVFYAFLKNATELQIKDPTDKDQIIDLDTGNISIFDFEFKELPEEIISKARKRTLDYFENT